MRFPLLAMMGTFFIFSAAYSLSILFFNVYIWQHTENMLLLCLFQLITFLFIFIGCLAGAYMMQIAGSRLNFFMSSCSATVMYIVLIRSDVESLGAFLMIAILNGLYLGMFYAGLNLYSLWFSENDQTSSVMSLQYVITGLAQLMTPPIAGWMIYMYGFDVVFQFAFLLLTCQTLFALILPQVYIREAYHLRNFFWPANVQLKYVGFSASVFGFFFAFVHMSFSIFVYLFVLNEWTLGGWNMVFAAISVLTYFILGRKMFKQYHEMLAKLGMILSTVVTIALWIPSPLIFIVFSTLVSVSLPMVWVPVFTRQFNTIRQKVKVGLRQPLSHMMELLVYRELFLFIGRFCFFALLLFCYLLLDHHALQVLITVLCFMPAALYMLGKRAGES